MYPWAYWPVAAMLALTGVIGWWKGRHLTDVPGRPLTVAMLLFVVAISLQLVPLPRATLSTISPELPRVLNEFDPLFANGLTQTHALSILPADSVTGLLLVLSFFLAFAGISRLLTLHGAHATAGAMAVIGVGVAVVGIVQRPLFSGKIYGFWPPQEAGTALPFGPFVNRNHFAGWMLLALGLSIGYGLALLVRTGRTLSDFRARAAWISSPGGNRLILTIAGVLTMAASVVLTLSRSGIAGLTVMLMVIAMFVASSAGSGRRSVKVGQCVLVLAVVIFGWLSLETVVARFAETDWRQFDERRGAWADALSIAGKFPLVGTGFNTYGVATLFYQSHNLNLHYAQAHNDYLQLAAEGGLLLGIPALICTSLFTIGVARRLREDKGRSTYWIRAGAVAGISALAFQETVDFSLQMPATAALFAVCCAVAVHRTPERQRPKTAAALQGRSHER